MIFLAILDGYGLADGTEHNAIHAASTPFLDRAWSEFPSRRLFAHGEYVGLPVGQMGNSEVGHLNIGGGRKIRPDLVVINEQIQSGQFFRNKVLLELIAKVKSRNGRLHLMGLLSDGGIHSHIRHLEALLKLIDENGPVQTFLHAYLDGRDTEPKVAGRYIKEAQAMLDSHPDMHFATVGGRSWGMDRDKNWPRIEKHYNTIIGRKPDLHASSAMAAVEDAFERGETDEFVYPTVIEAQAGINQYVNDGDGIIHFNFRADRGIQMTRVLTDEEFSEFDITHRPAIDMVTFTMYDEYLNVNIAFEGEILQETLTEVVTSVGKTVLKIAETEKWAHVTRFFNGGVMEPFDGEDRILVQSPMDVRPHYDKKPEMSAYEITDRVLGCIGKYDLIVLNFANADMVGHTGIFKAAVKAVETVDKCIERIYKTIRKYDGTMIIIADHGNADVMVDENGEPHTKHTTNPVPFNILDKHRTLREDEGSLKDIAPTILHLMGLVKPDVMTGINLVIA
jgi:2,3-bisphosphoglycerate-independent phosphoglycerate mutase